jgi:hypothetical protein
LKWYIDSYLLVRHGYTAHASLCIKADFMCLPNVLVVCPHVALDAASTDREYMWGGSSCGGWRAGPRVRRDATLSFMLGVSVVAGARPVGESCGCGGSCTCSRARDILAWAGVDREMAKSNGEMWAHAQVYDALVRAGDVDPGAQHRRLYSAALSRGLARGTGLLDSFVEVASEDRPPAYNSSENARPRPRYVAG